jgi:hypothetical protein
MSLIVPLLIFVIAVALALMAGARISAPLATSAWLMPLVVTSAMALVSAAIVIREILERRAAVASAAGTTADAPYTTGAWVAGWIALSAGYATVTPLVGFEWSTVVFLVVALKVFGGASWRLTLAVAVAMALVVPLVFRRLFFTLVP